MTSSGKVMIVDDDPDIREGIAEALAHFGYRVITAESGRIALDLLASGAPPAVVLLDLMMPDMDGWEVLRRIEQNPSLANMPVVILSAMDRSRVPPSAVHLRKPFDLEQLLAVVERYAGGS
jgi:CheY-like chemotaxis protein